MIALSTCFFILTVIWLLFKFLTKDADFFEKKGIKYLKPFPVLGMTYNMMKSGNPMGIILKESYDKFRNSRFFGVFELTNPIYVLRNPELIKQVTVKEFNSFVNHRFVFDENADKLFGRALFSLKDQKWRDMRNTLSPAFTGSKMRLMLTLMAESTETFIEHLVKKAEKEGDLEVEIKSLYEKYANDIIARTAFGVKVDTLKEPDNEFYRMGLISSTFKLIDNLKLLGFSAFPKLMMALKFKLIPDQAVNFFTQLITQNIKYRKENNVVINDMLHLMMEAQREGKIELIDEKDFQSAGFATVHESKDAFKQSNTVMKWEIDDMVGNAFQFLFAGFDTISTGIHFMAFELALNQDIQQRLFEEIKELDELLEGKSPTYENLQKMEYLDKVVSESLRKWPPAGVQDRKCTKSFVITDNNGAQVLLEPGQIILTPAYAIMHDPQYYPNPDKFDPERFSIENRKNINEFTYLPFGLGPRNCIGSRFALMEMKVAFYFLLLKFRLVMSSKTEIPLKLKTDTFQIRARNGVWVNLVLRK